MLSCLRSFAANDYVVETFVIDATSQPPLVGAVIKSGDVSKITAKGFVVTNDKTRYALEDADDINAGYTVECANYDCSAFEGHEFTSRMVHLKSNTKYYVYSYVVTDEGVHYGDAIEITSGNFNRCSERSDYANVYHAFEYTLFDGVTDEIIDPSTDGFYYSTNEKADYMGYQKGTSYNTCYKFKTEWSYKLWKYNQYYVWKYNTKIVPRQPVMTLSAKKLTMTTDEGATIYYCINGDGMRPENFTLKYTEPIDVEYGDVVYAYSISEQGYPSYTTAYKVLECLDEAKDFVVETFVIDGTSQPPLVGAVVKSGDMEKVTAKGFVVTTDKTKYAVEDAIPMVAWKDWAVECASFDCTDFKGKEFTRRIVELKGNTLYYIYSYIVTDNGTYYGNPVTITSWDYNRCPDLQGYANVYYSDKYSLFDMMTDELIEGGFYHSTNENPSYCGYSTDRSNHGVYKFKTKWSYKIFYAQAKSKTPSLPEMSVSDKKLTMTTDEDASIYYCINGDGLRPENFTLKYTEPIEVEYGDVVYAYSIREQEYPSYVRAYKVLECLDEAIINLIDNNPYTREESTDKYSKINYVRIFNNTSWQALYIPFSMSYDDWKNDFDVAYINGVRQLDMDDDGVIDKTTMDVVKIKSGNLIPNTPYLIKAKTTGEKTLSASGVTLHKAEENSIDCRTTIAEYTFTGTYTTIPASTLIANNYYAMGGGSLIITDGTSDLKPYRWYMKIDARNPMYNVSLDAKTITINVLNEESETTGVEELRIVNDKSPVYDINGRKVNDKNLKPGIYIKNGKKFVVK